MKSKIVNCLSNGAIITRRVSLLCKLLGENRVILSSRQWVEYQVAHQDFIYYVLKYLVIECQDYNLFA